jgi:hypothetical protein
LEAAPPRAPATSDDQQVDPGARTLDEKNLEDAAVSVRDADAVVLHLEHRRAVAIRVTANGDGVAVLPR